MGTRSRGTRDLKSGKLCEVSGFEYKKPTGLKEKVQEAIKTKVEEFLVKNEKKIKMAKMTTIIVLASMILFVFCVGLWTIYSWF